MEFATKINVNRAESTVKFESGATLGELLSSLADHQLGLFSVPNIHNVTMGGLLAGTGGHGDTSAGTSGTISNLIMELNFIGYNPTSGKYEMMTLARNTSAAEISPLLGGHEGRTFIISATIYVYPEAYEMRNRHVDTSAGFSSMHHLTLITSEDKVTLIKDRIEAIYREKFADKCSPGSKLLIRVTPIDDGVHHEAPALSMARGDEGHPDYAKTIWVEVLTPEGEEPECMGQVLDGMKHMVEDEFKDVALTRELGRDFERASATFDKYDPYGVFNFEDL
ncbi:putative L-gulonolactone oxidase 1 [Folsomia candida]|uniref:Putative L-gulonolactone oxidase 1 n=2 Tax=Folsomia candida TaxID=158441 RepID=A0A226CZJ9_FOLCA|nr:putative L-gulonolactone oxidase 1 [Folsomia candida]